MDAVTIRDVLEFASDLERSYVAIVHGRTKLRVGSIVYVAFSLDESIIGFGFPKEQRDGLVGSDPATFMLPGPSDMRFNWVHARLDRLDHDEMCEFVLDAWGMVVPRKLFGARLARLDPAPAD